jgi:opine dehydrogenase
VKLRFERIAVIGAGHGGCAVAADLTRLGREVHLVGRDERKLQSLASTGITLTHSRVGTYRPAVVTSDFAVVSDADLIIVVLPAHAHSWAASRLASHIRPTATIFLNPGHTGGGLHFRRLLGEEGQDPIVCESLTLTYVCRFEGPSTVAIYSDIKNLLFAALPAVYTDEILSELRFLFPNLVRAGHVLETGLMNMNAVMHPPGMLLNAGWIESTRGNFRFYSEGNTPAVAALIDALDEERVRIGTAYGLALTPFREFFYKAGLTTEEGYNSKSTYTAISVSPPNKTIKAPDSLENRYLDEDVPFGLVPFSEFAVLAGEATPTIDSLVHLASLARGRRYREEGLTLAKLGVQGMSPSQVVAQVSGG